MVFGLGSQACLMEQFVLWGGGSESPSTKAYVDVGGGCAKSERGASKWRTAVPPITESAALPHQRPARGHAQWRAPLFTTSTCSETSQRSCTRMEADALGKVRGMRLHFFPSPEMPGDP